MQDTVKRFSIRSAVTALACALTLNSTALAAVANCNADAMLVFDASASMAGVGYSQFTTPRIDEARDAVRQTMPDITAFRRVGLVIYGPGPNGTCGNIDLRLLPLPDAAARIIAEVEETEPDGGTPLTGAVQDAAAHLQGTGRPGIVVLVTDGADTCGGQPCRLASRLAPTNVTVHVIGFRLPFDTLAFSDHTTYVDKSELTASERKRLHTETRCLADRTGGQFVTADSTEELVGALNEVLICPLIGATGLGWKAS